jgi:hypothetical protein
VQPPERAVMAARVEEQRRFILKYVETGSLL